MHKLTKREWLRARWWAVLLYLGMTMIVVVSCWAGLSNPIMSQGCLWFCRILPFAMVGACIWLITSDPYLVGKCPCCGKVLLVNECVCPRCRLKVEGWYL